MIIRVCAPPEDKGSDYDYDIFKALRNVLIAFGEAKHLAWMHYKVINFIKNGMELGGHEQRILKELEEVENEYRFFHVQVGFHVNIDLADKHRIEYSESDKCIYVGYGRIKDTAALQRVSLLVEGVLDYRVFQKASESYLDVRKLNKFKACFEFENGAGGQVNKLFNDFSARDKFFVCVLDSDKKHPNEKLGDTALSFRHEVKGRCRGRELIILDSSEVENIIPCKVMAEAVAQNCTPEVASLFERFVRATPRAYLDHKLGITKEKAFQLDSQYGEYWCNTEAYERADDDGWLCKGLSESIGWRCLEVMDKMSINKLNKMVCDVHDEEWVKLGERLVAWGISRAKVVN